MSKGPGAYVAQGVDQVIKAWSGGALVGQAAWAGVAGVAEERESGRARRRRRPLPPTTSALERGRERGGSFPAPIPACGPPDARQK